MFIKDLIYTSLCNTGNTLTAIVLLHKPYKVM